VRSLLETLQNQISVRLLPVEENRGNKTDNLLVNNDPDDLAESLQRLFQLAKERTGKIGNVQAEEIIDDLDAILSNLLSQYRVDARKRERKEKEQAHGDDADNNHPSDMRALKRIKGLLNASHDIELNSKGLCVFKFISYGNS
jgi:hypothetical protein